MRWIAIVAGLVLASPSWAAETIVNWGLTTGSEPRALCVYDTSSAHTCVPVGQLDSTTHSYGNASPGCNVTAYGADPTGITDSSAAFNACAAKTVNGQLANVYLPAGTYYLQHQVTITGQCLYGDSKSNTIVHVDQTFDSAATGVIHLASGVGIIDRPCVHDLSFTFDQPSDQGVRANYKTLAAGCTSGTGGSGCKYPPAIYSTATGSGATSLITLQRLMFIRPWDAIWLDPAGGAQISNIQESALDVGLTMKNGVDFGSVSHWEHQEWGTSVTMLGVYQDGGTFAMSIGQNSGTRFEDIRTFQGRISLTSDFNWGSFVGLSLDGNNSTFEVGAVSAGAGGLQITDAYATGHSTGVNTHCQIDIAAGVVGSVLITNGHFGMSAGTTPAVCTDATGYVSIIGSRLATNLLTVPIILQTAGNLLVSGSTFIDGHGGNFTVPLVNVTGGTLQFLANAFPVASSGTPNYALAVPDAVESTVIGNSFNGWRFSAPGPLGAYGPNGMKCTASGASAQTCHGWSGVVTTNSLTTAALTGSTFTINNEAVTASSIVSCTVQSYSGTMVTNGLPVIARCLPSASTIGVVIYNAHTTNALAGTVAIGFTVQ